MDLLLEREDELAALVGAVDAARAGAGSLVLVAGEAGIGKTSLLRALRGRASQSASSFDEEVVVIVADRPNT